MNALTLSIWGFAGSLLAGLFFILQHWTVKKIHPQQIKGSKRLVIGGAVLRWILFSLLIFFALRYSFIATAITFMTFLLTRTFLLFSISRFSLAWPGNNRLN